MSDGLTYSAYVARCALLAIEPVREHDLTPVERAATLPSWLAPPLTATEAAREKLLAWATRTPSEQWNAPAADPADVLARLHAVGDEMIAHCVAGLLCRLPTCIRDYVLRQVTVLGVGVTMAGFAGPRVDYGDRPWLIVLGADVDVARLDRLTAHEIGHTWLLPEPGPDVMLRSAVACCTINNTPIGQVPPHVRDAIRAHREVYARDEQQAVALARTWGFDKV